MAKNTFDFPEDGRIKAALHMGDSDQKVFSGNHLNDNQWHTISFQRRGKTIELGVDESRPIIGKYLYSLSMRLY